MNDPNSAAFAARRLAARARLNAIDDAGAGDPYRRAWFEAVYETAGDDPAQIPWEQGIFIRFPEKGAE